VLPKRSWYDLHSAAAKLGCSESDLEYFIKEGQLRFAVSTEKLLMPSSIVLLRSSDLPEAVQLRLNTLVKPDLMRCFDVSVDNAVVKPVREPGDFLYLPYQWLSRMYVTEDSFGEVRAHMFQLLDGTEVSLWLDDNGYRLWGERLSPLDSSGFLMDAIVSHEELEKLLGAHEDSRGKPTEIRFVPPEKADEIALAMCDFANRYVGEFYKAPEPRALAAYMVKHGEKELGFTNTARDEYNFNGKRLTIRAIKDRLRTYSNLRAF